MERLRTDRLSAVLRQAIGDMDDRLAGVGEAAPKYIADGGVWHGPEGPRNVGEDEDLDKGECAVCLAGATFARFGVGPQETTSPHALHNEGRIDDDEYASLRALDELRAGSVLTAFHWWNGRSTTVMTRAMWDAAKRVEKQAEKIIDSSKIQVLRSWRRAREAYLELAGALEDEGL